MERLWHDPVTIVCFFASVDFSPCTLCHVVQKQKLFFFYDLEMANRLKRVGERKESSRNSLVTLHFV